MATPSPDVSPTHASSVKRLGNMQFLGLWVFANVGTWLLCSAFYLLLLGNVNTGLSNAIAPLLLLACPAIGTTQWLVLGKRLPISVHWVTATLCGGIIGVGVGNPSTILSIFLPCIIGFTVGIAQWIAFRSNCSSKVRWFFWVIATTLGGTLGYIASSAVPSVFIVDGMTAIAFILMGAVIQLVSNVITGSTLILLIRQHDRLKA